MQILSIFECSKVLCNGTFSEKYYQTKFLLIFHKYKKILESYIVIWNLNIFFNPIVPYYSLCSSGSRYVQYLGTFVWNNCFRNLPGYLPKLEFKYLKLNGSILELFVFSCVRHVQLLSKYFSKNIIGLIIVQKIHQNWNYFEIPIIPQLLFWFQECTVAIRHATRPFPINNPVKNCCYESLNLDWPLVLTNTIDNMWKKAFLNMWIVFLSGQPRFQLP